ncbi:hypothetical protein AURDEDRAFT_160529 [Auricularia subglabra TFB-10046 SS5]|nr:hypothetical protein AURDEDRAFT_160529 [Auricularia subglabra TFB-10046 SS5]
MHVIADASRLHPAGELSSPALGGTKRLDLYQSGRVDRTRPIEEQIQALAKLGGEGKLDHIGMSEVNEEELACKVQVSPAHYLEEIQAVVAAYSPISYGVLRNTGIGPNLSAEGDMRHVHPALQDERLNQIRPILDDFGLFANKKGITIAQVSHYYPDVE